MEQLWNEKGDEDCTVNERDGPKDHVDGVEAQERGGQTNASTTSKYFKVLQAAPPLPLHIPWCC